MRKSNYAQLWRRHVIPGREEYVQRPGEGTELGVELAEAAICRGPVSEGERGKG